MVRHRTPRSARRETAGGGRGPGGACVGRTRGTPRVSLAGVVRGDRGWGRAGRRSRGSAAPAEPLARMSAPNAARSAAKGSATGRGRRAAPGPRRAEASCRVSSKDPGARGRRRDPGVPSRARRPTPALERFPPPNKRLFVTRDIPTNGAGTTDATPRGSIPEAERLAARSMPSPSARAVAEANPRARACDRGRTPERPFFDFSHPRRRNVVTHADFATWEVSAHVSSAQRSTSGRPPYSACLRELGPHPLAPLRAFVLVRVLQYIRARLPP